MQLPSMRAVTTLMTVCALAAHACDSPAAEPLANAFDAKRAWHQLEQQVAFGPRPAGSAALGRCRDWIVAELEAAGLTPVRETFKEKTPVGEIEFGNVYADFAATDPKADMIILGSHFETKLTPPGFLGANDSGSSTAVLLELARVITRGGKRPFTYRFLFLDGEEAMRHEWQEPDNTYGSRYHARKLKESGKSERTRAFILLDLCGDKDLRFNRDTYSDSRILELFYAAARKNGLGKHVDGRALEARDDHLSFMNVGIPSIDLIDLEYGPNNSYWHTTADTLEHCSQASLEATGKIVLFALPELEQSFKR
jgi:glutaminyl-peptide cyclotransferase